MPNLSPTAFQCLSTICGNITTTMNNIEQSMKHIQTLMTTIDKYNREIDEHLRKIHEHQRKVTGGSLQSNNNQAIDPTIKYLKELRAITIGKASAPWFDGQKCWFPSDSPGDERSKKRTCVPGTSGPRWS